MIIFQLSPCMHVLLEQQHFVHDFLQELSQGSHHEDNTMGPLEIKAIAFINPRRCSSSTLSATERRSLVYSIQEVVV